eukprot:scaffold687_cov119-Isochrysis_galbana.AAC.5
MFPRIGRCDRPTLKADGTTPSDGYTLPDAMLQDERRQEFRYEEQAKAAKLARITADKSDKRKRAGEGGEADAEVNGANGSFASGA